MRGRAAITGVLACALAASCTSHESSRSRREPADGDLLRPDEAPDPVPPGVEMWIDDEGVDFEVEGVRTHVLDFGPELPSMKSHGERSVHALTLAELQRQASADAELVVHVDPDTPAAYLGHALYHAGYWRYFAFVVETEAGPRVVHARNMYDSRGEDGLFTTLHVEVGRRGTTAQWHAPNTGPAKWWAADAAIGARACAEQPSRASVRADLAKLLTEGCGGAEISPQVHFDRSVTISRELPSGVVIQTLAALAHSCRADRPPWLLALTDKPVAAACEPDWDGETRDYAWFRDEALTRARIDIDGPPSRVWPARPDGTPY